MSTEACNRLNLEYDLIQDNLFIDNGSDGAVAVTVHDRE